MKESLSIGEKIKELRQEKLMTQAELAQGIVTRSMLSLIENGNAEPSLPTLRSLAERLSVTPSYLLASEAERSASRREHYVKEIRIAYRAREYRICYDLCKTVGLLMDDEIYFLLAESALGLALERIHAGNLRAAAPFLEDAVSCAEETCYRSEHLFAEVAVLMRYLRRFSDSYYSELEDVAEEHGVPISAAVGNPFCSYAWSMIEIDEGALENEVRREAILDRISLLHRTAPSLALHLEAIIALAEGRQGEALTAIEALLAHTAPLPQPILYEVFRDRESCCREIGDYKRAYESASAKHDLLSRLLSE